MPQANPYEVTLDGQGLIFHLEFQRHRDVDMAKRILEYNVYVLSRLKSVTPCLKGKGLGLDSTAILHSEPAVQLWLQRPTHQGVLTKHPSSASLAG